MVERSAVNRLVRGSNPLARATKNAAPSGGAFFFSPEPTKKASLPAMLFNYPRLLFIFQDISWLAIQSLANCLQRREPNSFGLPILQYRNIGHGDADLLSQLRNAHLSFCQHHIDVNNNCHSVKRLSRSRI